MRLAILAFLFPTLCIAAPTTLRVVDGSGAPAKDVLVIVKSFGQGYEDVSRHLTDEQGRVPTMDLQPGVYQAIATSPYGIWETSVKEFLVEDKSFELTLTVTPQPTHGFGDVVPLVNATVEVQIVASDGIPASDAEVFVRDKDATLYTERWYKMDKNGKGKVELVADQTVLVVIYAHRLFTTQLDSTKKSAVIRFPPY